jgi:hypothetical protein
MTAIAWDGVTLAADRLAIGPGGVRLVTSKLSRHSTPTADYLLAVVGDVDPGHELHHWFVEGAVPKDFPQACREGNATLVVIVRSIGDGAKPAVHSYCAGPLPFVQQRQIGHGCGWGSGSEAVRTAIWLGCTAEAAVSAAAEVLTSVGCGVDTLQFERAAT